MATNANTRKSRPATSRKGVRPLTPGRGTSKLGRSSATTRSHGLVARVQTLLPSAGRNTRKSPAQKVAGALSKATGGTTARVPVTKRMVGVAAGGVGAAAMAKRRRTHPKRLPETTSAPAVQADSEHRPQRIETTADPSASTGGDHGDPTDQVQPPPRDPGDHNTGQPAEEHSSDPVKSEPRGDLLARIGINLNDLSRGAGGKTDL